MVNEWETEPNQKRWVAKDTGFHCLILRHPELGHLCGYVGLERDHPLFGKNEEHLYSVSNEDIDVHGGLTFARHMKDHGGEEIWWFGFDCAHSGDMVPRSIIGHYKLGRSHEEFETYKNIQYVERQVNRLAEQLGNKLKWLVLVGMGQSKVKRK